MKTNPSHDQLTSALVLPGPLVGLGYRICPSHLPYEEFSREGYLRIPGTVRKGGFPPRSEPPRVVPGLFEVTVSCTQLTPAVCAIMDKP